MPGSSHFRSVLIGIEYRNCCLSFDAYFGFAIWIRQIQSKLLNGLSCTSLEAIAYHRAEFLQEGILFLVHFFARDVLVMKKLEIKKTKPTFIISILKVETM